MTISNNPQPGGNFDVTGGAPTFDGTISSTPTETPPAMPPVQLGPIDSSEVVSVEGTPFTIVQYDRSMQKPALPATLNTPNKQSSSNSSSRSSDSSTGSSSDAPPADAGTNIDTLPIQAPPSGNPALNANSSGTGGAVDSSDSGAVADSNTDTSVTDTNTANTTATIDTAGTNTVADTPVTADSLGVTDLQKTLGGLDVSRLFQGGYVDNPGTIGETLNNQVQFTEEGIDAQIAYLKTLPDSPEKDKMIDFLMAISAALGELRKVLQEMQAFNSEAAKNKSTAQMERSTMNLDKQLDQIQEMGDERVKSARKEASMAKLGLSSESIGIIVTSLLILATIPVCIANPVAGAVIMTVLIAVLVDQCMKAAGMDKGLFDYMMDGLDTLSDDICDSCEQTFGITVSQDVRDGLGMALKLVVVIAITAVTAVFSPTAACTVLPALMQAAGIGTTLAKLCGGDEKVQQWVEFGLTCAVMIATIVVSFKANAGKYIEQGAEVTKSAMEKVGKAVTGLSNRASEIFGDVGGMIPDKVASVLKYATKPDVILSVAGIVSQTASVTVGYQNAKLQADITEIQGDMDAETAAKDAIVKVLKDIIQKLLDALTGLNSALETINSMSENMYRNISANVGFA